eukprot:12758518-Ditylum_brightwellii.AAC.1
MKEACHQLLDYVAVHPNAVVKFMASDMILAVHLDALYISKSNTRSQAAGNFYLATKNDGDYNNGAILTLSTFIQHVVALALKAKLAALFYNSREAVPPHATLEEMGHTQPATPLITNNNMSHGLTTRSMAPRWSKAIDMRFHWLKCWELQ